MSAHESESPEQPSCISTPTNDQRASWALSALNAYSRATRYGEEITEPMFTEIVGDLMADLLHLADGLGASLDFVALADRAAMHHEAEASGREW